MDTISLWLLVLFLGANPVFAQNDVVYRCPPCGASCDTLQFHQPGICSHCQMELIPLNDQVSMTTSERPTIAFYLQDGVEILDFAGPLEVFTYAGYRVFTVTKTKAPIRSQGVLQVQPDYSIADAPPATILAFFGGNSSAASGDTSVINWVQEQGDIDYYFSVCTGAFVLAEAGLLDGKTATTFHQSLDQLAQNYPSIDVRPQVRFVDNGNVITTAGISAGIDGALHLVAKLDGLTAARRVAHYMEYDKWQPGEGLLLTNETPYARILPLSALEAFKGTYEFTDNRQVRLSINERTRCLEAHIGQQAHPLTAQEATDTFQTIDGALLRFQRDAQGRVNGFQFTADSSRTYQRLKP